MKTLNVMLKPASSLCNMRCRYCFYADEASARHTPSYGIMTEATADLLVERVSEFLSAGDAVHYIFQGGEPTLAGLPFFAHFVRRATSRPDIRVSFSLQTNGLLLDADFCRFLAKHRFLVGVSLDLLPEIHDAARKDAGGEGTYARILSTLSLLKREGVPFNVLCTLTDAVAKRPKQVRERLLRLDIDYVQFTPCLGPMDGTTSPDTLTAEQFASFYTEFFALWYEDYQKGRKRSIKLFDDIVNLLVLGTPTACGMDGKCRPQLVIEADGSVYPCDFYCTDEYRLGSIRDTAISEIVSGEGFRRFSLRERSVPIACQNCRYARFCGGGCPRMQSVLYNSESGFCGYRAFLDTCGEGLFHLAQQLNEKYFSKKK